MLLRLAFIREPMRFDEAYTFEAYASQPFHLITHLYDLPNNQVLNTILVHFSWRLLGNHVWSIRLPALVAGCALAVLAAAAADRLYGRPAAVWAAALTAVWAPLVDFSVNARGYVIGLALLLVALVCAASELERRRWWPWVIFAACCALATYAVPTMAYGVAAIGLWAVATALLRRRAGLVDAAAAAIAVAVAAGIARLLYAPLLGQPGWTIVPPLPRQWPYVRGLAEQTWALWNRAAPHPLDWIVAAGFAGGLVAHRRIRRLGVPIAIAGAVVAVGVLLLTSPLPPYPRSWIALLPLYLITAAAGLSAAAAALASRLRAPVLAPAAAVVTAAALAVALLVAGQQGSEEPPKSANDIVGFVKTHPVPGGQLGLNPRTYGAATIYYFDRDHFAGVSGYITPGQRLSHHVWIVIPRDQPDLPAFAAQVARSLGGSVPAAPAPRLVRRWTYVAVYDVPLAG